MSPEVRVYVQMKKEASPKKAEYVKPQSWGVNTNKRLSNTQVWRK